jgi:U4/U6.U5 tri-snRNP-associated protein 1
MDVEEPSRNAGGSGLGLREMSEAEMNAIRAKLGLKPLDPTPAAQLSTDKDDSILSTAERLRLAKERRMERERSKAVKEKLVTLGDSDEEDNAAGSWVERHKRILEEKKRAEAQAKQLEEIEEAQLNTEPSFAGLKVAHDADQLTEDTVLVIRDQSVLGGDDMDELESSELVSIEKGKRFQEKKKKKSKYDLYDDEGNSKGILAQYDEEEQEEKDRKAKGFVLGSGHAGAAKRSSTSAKRSIVNKSAIPTMEVDEDNDGGDTITFGAKPTLSSDFEVAQPSETEEVTFGKKGSSNGGKKVRKIRKRAVEIEIEESSGSALDALEPVSTSRFGTRNDRLRIADEEEDKVAAQRQRNFAKYQNALKAAAERSDSVFKTVATGDDSIRLKSEDIVARTREIRQKATDMEIEQESEDSGIVFSSLTDFIVPSTEEDDKESVILVKQENNTHEGQAMEIDDSEREAAPTLSRPSVPTNKAQVKQDECEDQENGESEELAVKAAAQRLKKGRAKKSAGLAQEDDDQPERPNQFGDALVDDTPEGVTDRPELKEEELPLFAPTEESQAKSSRVHQGLGSTLALLMQRGGLEEPKLLAGREKDRRMQDMVSGGGLQTTSFPGKKQGRNTGTVPEYYREIEIERKDQWGRPMTSKEAFKAFSSDFSGNKSGKRKQEKKFEKMKAQIKHQQALTDSGIERSLTSVQSVQKQAASPFVVLNSQSLLAGASGVQDMVLGDGLKSDSSAVGSSSVMGGGTSTIRK